MKVLVADDDPVVRFLVSDLVKEWGHQVISACDGQQAWEALSEPEGPRIAILDWTMPKLDGLELCRRVKTDSAFPYVYIILLTARSEKKESILALDTGADDFLAKPVNSAELKSRLNVGFRTLAYKQTLIEKNQRLQEYADEMETLAEIRAKQLVHTERLAMLGTLAAGLAHELANPITFITGNIEILRGNWECAEPHLRKYIETGGGDTERLKRALDDIPDVWNDLDSGVERTIRLLRGMGRFSQKGNDVQGACAIKECVENALNIADSRLKHKAVVEKELPDDLPVCPGSSQQLEQVFINLFVNAADAMEPRGGTLKIEAHQADDRLLLTVEDSGPGIPADELDSIWEAFFTTKDTDKGTGLGLSISRGIIEDHGGTIRAENKKDGGARFLVELPITTKEKKVSKRHQHAPRNASIAPNNVAPFIHPNRRDERQGVTVSNNPMPCHRKSEPATQEIMIRK